MKTYLIKFIGVLTLITTTEAGVGLDKFFNKLGSKTNLSQAGSFKDQAAGYYTGGGFALREGSTTINPITVSLPKMGAGCNNLDLYFGSLSFIKSDQLVKMLKQLKSGVPTYAFQLALKSFSPMIEGLSSELREKIQNMNATMLNSCQLSQQIVGGFYPKGTAASEQICMDSKRGGNDDWFGARSHCKGAESANETINIRKKYKDLMVGEYNLVWHVIRKMSDYSGPAQLEMAEFVMSIVGTLISVRDGDGFRSRIIAPRADQKEFVSAYLKGGQTSILKCDESDKCLKPTVSIHTISDHGTANMKGKVMKKIIDLRQKYIERGGANQDDIGFLNDSVNVPVYKYIQVSAASGTSFMLQDAAEYIAISILLTQFEKVTTEVLDAIDAIEKIQLDNSAIHEYKSRIQEMRSLLQMMMGEANYGAIATLNSAIKANEQRIVALNS